MSILAKATDGWKTYKSKLSNTYNITGKNKNV